MKRFMITYAMVVFSSGMFALANDTDLNERRARGTRYEAQADWSLHFEDWEKLGVIGALATNREGVTIQTTKVKDIGEALAKAGDRKDLAVIIVSHRFLSHYAKDAGEKQLDALSERARQAGFKRVVFLSETAVGNLPMRE